MALGKTFLFFFKETKRLFSAAKYNENEVNSQKKEFLGII